MSRMQGKCRLLIFLKCGKIVSMQTVPTDSKIINELEKKLEGALKDLRELKMREQEIPNARTRKILKQAEKDWKAGKGSPVFKTGEEAVAWLDKQGI